VFFSSGLKGGCFVLEKIKNNSRAKSTKVKMMAFRE
jgi:hypothetical protein